MVINDRFPVLSTLAKLIWGLGILLCLIGVIAGIAELLQVFKLFGQPGAEWQWTSSDIVRLVIFFLGLFFGFFSMAMAEIIGVFFAIEKNTRS